MYFYYEQVVVSDDDVVVGEGYLGCLYLSKLIP